MHCEATKKHVRSIVFCICLAVAMSNIIAAAWDEAQQGPESINITVRAKDTGKPLPGATVRAWIDMTHRELTADGDGRVHIKLTGLMFPDSLAFDVWASGYVQQIYTCSQVDPRFPKIPAQFDVALLPGEETLGGKIVDEQGRPIAGVKVTVWGYLGEKKLKSEVAFHVSGTTDSLGQWRCRSFRSMTFAYLYLSHPDYLSDNDSHPRRHGRPMETDPAPPDEKPMAGLRDFSAVQVMARGIELSGKVVDQHAAHVPGAEVGWMPEDEKNAFHDSLATTQADAEGRFRFPHVRPGGKLMLQVKAKGHAPALKAVEPGNAVIVKLEAPHTLKGRVVDSHGNPIVKSFIAIDTWRNCRSLGVFLTTGRDGRFR